jgi:uncharacterized protein YcbX
MLMSSFRPNIVMGPGTAIPAWDEDCWARFRIRSSSNSNGGIEFHVVKPCSRCTIPTVLPDTGTRRKSGEPLRTLRRYRMRASDGPYFGQNLIHQSIAGRIRVGDTIEVLERKKCSVPKYRMK